MIDPNELQNLWDNCSLTNDRSRLKQLDYVCRNALNNQAQYQVVQNKTNVPWPIVAAIHFRESDQSFKCHLHNGDPLSDRTVHVPKNRPIQGTPPFTWMESAIDVLTGVWQPYSWSLPGSLEFIERYNGLGYRRCGIHTPYLWNYTDKYLSGLFVADGRFVPDRIEARPGCVSILKTLIEMGVSIDFSTITPVGSSLH